MACRHVLCVVGFAVMMSASVASAAFTTPSWSRPMTGAEAASGLTTHQWFDVFSDDDGDVLNGMLDTSPDVANVNPVGSATVSSQVGFLTSTGNLYNPTAQLDVLVTVPNYNLGSGYVTRIFVQVQTQGNPFVDASAPDFSGFTVNGVSLATLSPVYTLLGSTGGSPLGAVIDHGIEFTVPENVESYEIAWLTEETSVAHRAIAVDTIAVAVVPEPTMLGGLAGLALTGSLRARRRVG